MSQYQGRGTAKYQELSTTGSVLQIFRIRQADFEKVAEGLEYAELTLPEGTQVMEVVHDYRPEGETYFTSRAYVCLSAVVPAQPTMDERRQFFLVAPGAAIPKGVRHLGW